jgi:RNA polymerase sigma-70 factor (ECF subfamily)
MDRRNDTVTAHATIPPDLLLAHAGALRALALSLLGDEHAAEDVLQETFVRALRSPPSSREGIGGWLHRVAQGFALKRRRSEGRRARREELYARERPEAGFDARSRGENLREVVDAVLSLEEPYRETVLLRWFEGLPPRVIAEQAHVSVATVNSRLQRAHAGLREKLERKLRGRDGGFEGAMLALFGTRAETSSSAASISLTGLYVTSTVKLIVCAAALVLAVCAVWLLRSSPPEPLTPGEVASASVPIGIVVAPLEPSDAARSRAAGIVIASAEPSLSAERAVGDPEPGPFAFDVTFVPIDGLERPLADVEVLAGPDTACLNRLGTSAWNGELHCSWRGFERAFDAVLLLRGPGTTALRRVRFVAGVPQKLAIGMEVTDARLVLDMDAARSDHISARDAVGRDAESMVFSFETSSRSRPAAPDFALDAAGNGVFTDPGLLVRAMKPKPPQTETTQEGMEPGVLRLNIELAERSGSWGRLAFSGGVDDTAGTARLTGIVRDERGRPLAHALVTTLCPRADGRRETKTDDAGHFELAGLPSGPIEILAGGGAHAIAHERIELAPAEERTFDPNLADLPVAKARLVDERGEPLAGWYIEAREAGSPGGSGGFGGFIGRATSDDAGRFHVALPNGGPARLLARPGDAQGEPKLVASERFVVAPEERDVVVRGRVERAKLTLEIAPIEGVDVRQAEVRIWRLDSDEGACLVRHASEEDGSAHAAVGRERFEMSGLLPGIHAIDVLVPGAPVRRIASVSIAPGRDLDLGVIALDAPVRLSVSSGGSGGASGAGSSTIALRERLHGAIVRSNDLELGQTADLLTGSVRAELVFVRKPASESSDEVRETHPIARELRAKSGEVVEVGAPLLPR